MGIGTKNPNVATNPNVVTGTVTYHDDTKTLFPERERKDTPIELMEIKPLTIVPSEELKKHNLNVFLKEKVASIYPNLKECYTLQSLFVDLIIFRLLQKKDKTSLIQATVNQVHISIQLTPEEVKEYGLI